MFSYTYGIVITVCVFYLAIAAAVGGFVGWLIWG